MSGKTNRFLTQYGQERYGDEAVVGATAISQNGNNFVDTVAEFEAARTEGSTEMTCSWLERGLNENATGTAAESKEEETQESEARERLQPSRNWVDQATRKINTIFRGSRGWGNAS